MDAVYETFGKAEVFAAMEALWDCWRVPIKDEIKYNTRIFFPWGLSLHLYAVLSTESINNFPTLIAQYYIWSSMKSVTRLYKSWYHLFK